MPELPEVETLRADLEANVCGARVASVAIGHPRTVRRQDPAEFAAGLTDRRLVSFGRVGKYLTIGLDPPGVLVVHLRMSGALVLCSPDDARAPHTHARLALGRGDELRFVDPRTFGELFLTTAGPGGRPIELAGLGPDPLTDGVGLERLAAICAGRRAAVKTVLLDQRRIAGIGNIYGDEICFAAGIAPQRPAGRLRRRELARLEKAIETVLAAAVAGRGSTLSDERYRDLFGGPGAYQDHHFVYGRAGKPCRVCGHEIARRIVSGRSAHLCPSCQR